MSPVTLYHMDISPPCRSVRLTASHLGLKLNLKEVNVFQGEHKQEQFLRLNPTHTIPTIKDGDFVLWESRAIQAYLATAYDKNGDLYPSDLKIRSKINRLLFFDCGTLYQRFMDYASPVYLFGATQLDPAKKAKLEEAVGFLETFLSEGGAFVAGDRITIADHALVVTVSTIKATDVVDVAKYGRVSEWLSRCEREIPGYEENNQKQADEFRRIAESKLAQLTQK